MEPRANHVVIGALTLALILGMALFGLWLARFGAERETLPYDVIFREAVSGLSEGSRVEYNGLRVGAVSELRIDEQNPNQVIARIQIASETPVTADTQARIAMTNVTGASHIQLSTDTLDGPPLSREEGVPAIVAEPSPIARLTSNWEETVGGINELLDNLNQVLSEENAQSITLILSNLEEVSGYFAGRQEQVDQLTEGVAQAGRTANQALSSLDALVGELGLMVERHGEPLLGSAQRTIASLEEAAAGVERLLRENRAAFEQGMRGMHGIEPAVRDFRSAIDTLERGARQFDEDPPGYLLGRERLPEFEP